MLNSCGRADNGMTEHSAATLGLGKGGDMGERIREFDWSKTPLGPIAQWQPSLRTCVNILLPLGPDAFTWQSIERSVGEAELPGIPPVRVTRVKNSK